MTLLRVAWMSILLGIVVQGVVIAVSRAMPQSLLAEVAGKVTWSLVVCSAVALASVASKALPAAVSGAGLLAAPVAIAAARTIQKGLSGAMTASAVAAAAPGAVEMGIVKALQYALFGWLICRAQKAGTLRAHLAVSVPVGVVFAGYIVWRTWTTTEPDTLHALSVVAKGVGDTAATVGCSVVLWAGVVLGVKKN